MNNTDPRFLTSLELRRLTGSTSYDDQLVMLEAMNIEFKARTIVGSSYVIGINCYDIHVQNVIGDLGWQVVEDEIFQIR